MPNRAQAPEGLTFTLSTSEADLPEGVSIDSMSVFLHETMKPWHDTVPDVKRGLDYALENTPGRGGFIITAMDGATLVGAVVILETGMKGYVPGNLLLFIAVSPSLRGGGIGGALLREAAKRCEGDMCLHVEPDNPARRLYERNGFKSKYLEMRLDKV